MAKYKSKYITVHSAIRESYTTTIKFGNEDKPKEIIVRNIFIVDFFTTHYKHRGINSTNVEDFLNRTDAKYKVELEDIERFLDEYLYDIKCALELEEPTEELD